MPAGEGFGARLEAARTKRQLTQSQLAERTGLGKSLLSRLEREVRGSTEAETLLKLTAVLEVRPEWLWRGEGPMDISPTERKLWAERKLWEDAVLGASHDPNLRASITELASKFHPSVVAVAETLSRNGERHTVSGWKNRLAEIDESLSPILPTGKKK